MEPKPPKIFGWLADHAGCGWYRVMLPLQALSNAGQAQVRWDGKMTEADWDADVIVAQRSSNEQATQVIQRIVRSKGERPLVVLEIDDDLLNIDRDNPVWETFNKPEVRSNLTRNIQVADLVTVSTEPLAEAVSKLNPRVAVLPNCIPGEMLRWRHGSFEDRMTVGWQGSPTHVGDWAPATRAVARWFKDAAAKLALERFPLEMHSIGALPPTFPKVDNHRHTPWNRSIPHYYRTIDWDIALAPLARTTFNRSKSDIRVLEAAMLGIPVVASDVPAYHDSVQHESTGFLVTNPRDWHAALDALLDWSRLSDMSRRARKWAQTRTIDAHAGRWLEAYEKARSGGVV